MLGWLAGRKRGARRTETWHDEDGDAWNESTGERGAREQQRAGRLCAPE